MMKELLVTGGLGFLGSYTLEKFKQDGSYNITVIDNLSSNTISPNDKIADGCGVIIKNCTEYDWKKSKKFDLIIHLASPVGPVGILKHSGRIAKAIIEETYWAIEGTRKFNCPLIFVSTSEIYGYRGKVEFLREDDYKMLVGDFKVRNEYSIAKLLSEIILSNLSKIDLNLKYHIIRPFNISGPRQLKDGGFVLPTFFEQAFANKPITVFLDGKQIRSFTHARDIVDGFYLLSHGNTTWNQIWNVGTKNNTTTIGELATKVKRITGSSSEIINVDPKALHGKLYEEAWDKVPDSYKLETELGWNARYSIDDIIEDLYKYYKEKN